ncbi:MAG: hypothetical protein LBM77_13580 [Spirochaetaceae bacterium]|jgi:hypothetical protein|nr:hypothetical protein [Spirochaetaceae bacterium]
MTNSVIDNTTATVGDFLKENVKEGSKLSIVSAYFTIFAYEAMKQTLDPAENVRFFWEKEGY